MAVGRRVCDRRFRDTVHVGAAPSRVRAGADRADGRAACRARSADPAVPGAERAGRARRAGRRVPAGGDRRAARAAVRHLLAAGARARAARARAVPRLRRRGDGLARRTRRSRRSAPARGRRGLCVPVPAASWSSSSSWPATTRSATASPAKGWRWSSGCGAASSPRVDADAVGALPRPRVPARARGRGRARLGRRAARATCTRPRSTARRSDALLARPLGRAARDLGDRPRPPRHGLAVAARGDLPQARAHHDRPAAAARRLSRARLRALAGPALRVAARARAGAVRAGARGRRRRAAGSRSAARGSSPTATCRPGESLARQFLYGQRFFEAELGRRCTEFWNPDVFGYTAQLPQLMREAGITRFLTQKLSWNRFTQPEHHTFTWQGLDGSEVLTHFPPADTYNAEATVAELHREGATYKDHGRSRHSLLVFGHGDGGGGPTAEMLERLRRARDIAGLPRTTVRSPVEFFDALEARRPRPAHRRRRALLRAAPRHVHVAGGRSSGSTAAARARCATPSCWPRWRASAYPREQLARAVADAAAQPVPRHPARAARSPRSTCAPGPTSRGVVDGAEAICAAVLGEPERPVNLTPFARREVVGDALYATSRRTAPGEPVAGEVTRRRAACWPTSTCGRRSSPDGTVTSLLCGGREALAAPANRLELYEDEPTHWEAWDVDPAHLETRRGRCRPRGSSASRPPAARRGASSTATGSPRRSGSTPGRGGSRSTPRSTGSSTASCLKVAFPLAVRATDVTYEVAFGAVQRPTHYSTRADLARYEVPGHRWADMSEHGFGVAVLTDSKYGYSAFGDTLRISLLRAPRNPDPEADRGPPHVRLRPPPPPRHLAGRGRGRARRRRSTRPVRWGALPPGSLASATGGLVLDTVKRAEDSDALILRLYEPHGGARHRAHRPACPRRRAWRANLLEEPRRGAGDRGRRDPRPVPAVGDRDGLRPRPPRRSRSSRSRSTPPCAARSRRTPRRRAERIVAVGLDVEHDPLAGQVVEARPPRGRTGRPRTPARVPAASGLEPSSATPVSSSAHATASTALSVTRVRSSIQPTPIAPPPFSSSSPKPSVRATTKKLASGPRSGGS